MVEIHLLYEVKDGPTKTRGFSQLYSIIGFEVLVFIFENIISK